MMHVPILISGPAELPELCWKPSWYKHFAPLVSKKYRSKNASTVFAGRARRKRLAVTAFTE